MANGFVMHLCMENKIAGLVGVLHSWCAGGIKFDIPFQCSSPGAHIYFS